ncbi:unnamed protein product [Urochloa humidicola]
MQNLDENKLLILAILYNQNNRKDKECKWCVLLNKLTFKSLQLTRCRSWNWYPIWKEALTSRMLMAHTDLHIMGGISINFGFLRSPSSTSYVHPPAYCPQPLQLPRTCPCTQQLAMPLLMLHLLLDLLVQAHPWMIVPLIAAPPWTLFNYSSSFSSFNQSLCD